LPGSASVEVGQASAGADLLIDAAGPQGPRGRAPLADIVLAASRDDG
jgi:hypothetical protein